MTKKSGECPSTAATTAAAVVIAHNDDLLMELLLHLPAKSLIRFKSVCKHWRSLISAASFSHRHTRHHRYPQSSLLFHAYPFYFFYLNPTTKKFIELPGRFNEATVRQSCHGLMLLHCGYSYSDTYIYNPTTGESRNLLLKDGFFLGLYLEFDPSESPHYRVVCLRSVHSLNNRNFVIEVYSSETHTWEKSEKVYPNLSPQLCDMLYWKNYIYFFTVDGHFICLDIENDVFRLPPIENFSIRLHTRGLTLFSLNESGDRVDYIAHSDTSNSVVCDITQKGCHESLKCIAEFNDFTVLFSAMAYKQMCFIGVMREERGEESLVFNFVGKILVYRLSAGKFEELVDLNAPELVTEDKYISRWQGCYHGAYQFVESLAPV